MLRIVAAGEILMHTINCATMVSESFDYATKESQLSGTDAQYASYESDLSSMYIYTVAVD